MPPTPPPDRLVGIARLARQSPQLEQKQFAEYRQLPSYKLLNRCSSERMPFEWTINPYRGCEFGCVYCYARYTHEFMELRDPYEFESRIFAKQWNPDQFRADLRRLDPRERIAIGTATDPYQPAERRYGLTRSILEALIPMRGRCFGLTTKSDLVARDAELLEELARHNTVSVAVTITTVDTDLARKLEPRAPRPDLRLKAVSRLAAARGVSVGVFCAPLMPLINDREWQLDALAAEAAAAGAQWFAGNVLFLTETPRQVFFEFVDREFPQLAAKYRQQFGGGRAYLRGAYPDAVRERVRRARERHRLANRGEERAWEDVQLPLTF